MMLLLQNISYIHPNKELLFGGLNLAVNQHEKIALVGNNGTGKSTLLKIIAGELLIGGGQRTLDTTPYYVPQIFGQFNHWTVAQALKADTKINALHAILDGATTAANYTLLNDDWTIEERCQVALQDWQLNGIDLSQTMSSLSGGQKTKVFLAGIAIHQPDLILMDEPSNHLDRAGRQLLYDFIQTTRSTLLLVSHDRILLNLLDTVCELSKEGLKTYGGNYDFYREKKQIEKEALSQDIQHAEKSLRKAREKERETIERQQKLDARGKKKQEKAGVAKIMMNTLRNKAENSTSKLQSVHATKIDSIAEDLYELRAGQPGIDGMRFGFDDSALHKGKILVTATGINYVYNKQGLWKQGLDIQITSGERIAIKGSNGSGKTTLIQLITGKLEPPQGNIRRANFSSVYIDQDYSLLDHRLSVYQQAEKFNTTPLPEHAVKIRLNRFLFVKTDWDKPCSALSGGESMRLSLCCLGLQQNSPDMIILDEPTNNLDLQNVDILAAAMNEYRGTLIVVSHDETFLAQVNIERLIDC